MKNIEQVIKKLIVTIKNNQKIVIFGDADLDGVVSAIILKKSLEYMGASVKVYLSNREKMGHGITEDVVLSIKHESPAVLVSVDCGISSFDGVAAAKDNGFYFIIIDHHQPLSHLPNADIIVDPKQEGDNYPNKDIANAVITLILSEKILKDDFHIFEREFTELATLASVADMLFYKELIDKGTPMLEDTQIPALRALRKKIEGNNFIQKLVSILNITDIRGDVNDAFIFLLSKNIEEAEKILDRIYFSSKKKREDIKKAAEKIIENDVKEDVIVFAEGGLSTHLSGSIAAKVISKVKKPTFIYQKGENNSRGSVRMPSKINAIEAMNHCCKYLEEFGGHPPAAGFAIKNENIDNFKNCLVSYIKSLQE